MFAISFCIPRSCIFGCYIIRYYAKESLRLLYVLRVGAAPKDFPVEEGGCGERSSRRRRWTRELGAKMCEKSTTIISLEKYKRESTLKIAFSRIQNVHQHHHMQLLAEVTLLIPYSIRFFSLSCLALPSSQLLRLLYPLLCLVVFHSRHSLRRTREIYRHDDHHHHHDSVRRRTVIYNPQ